MAELEQHRDNLVKVIRLVVNRLGGEDTPMPPHVHQFRTFNNGTAIGLCSVCNKNLLPISIACSGRAPRPPA